MASMKRKISKGCNAVISDTTNIIDSCRRSHTVKAGENIHKFFNKKSPRGVNVSSLHSVESASMQSCTARSRDGDSRCTVKQALKARPEILELGRQIIQTFIERNSPFHLQEAITLNIFSVAVSDGSGIIDACNLAAKCTGFHIDAIRKWAGAVFRDFFGTIAYIDNVDDESSSFLTEDSTQSGSHLSMMKVSS